MIKKPYISIFILCLLLLAACQREEPEALLLPTYTIGEVVGIDDVYGKVFVYMPTDAEAVQDVLVIIHGTPDKDGSAETTAQSYIDRWLDYADENSVALIAPSFSQADFSSKFGEVEDSLTGYRGLFGRQIGADDWVLRIANAYTSLFTAADGKISLYGHSAGGQYVSRFVMMHPEVVSKAVISAAATYPQPTEAIAWPFGMGDLSTEIEWDDQTIVEENVIPETQKWLEATQIPLQIIVGMNDTAEQPQRMGQEGTTRLSIGRNWVQNMQQFAAEYNLSCDWKVSAIPNVGHADSALVPHAQHTLNTLE